MPVPVEETQLHTRIMKCTLEVEHCRAYWEQSRFRCGHVTTAEAFEKAIFGSRTYQRVERLMADMRHRFDAFPESLDVLKRWPATDPADRRLVCHWHLQLADPLYRSFTGSYLLQRLAGARPVVDRQRVVEWVEVQAPERWQIPTRMKIASKLMTSAFSAGLLKTNRDPRPIIWPSVSDTALTYLLYLLRNVRFAGSLIDNPYAGSVGLDTETLIGRLRTLPALRFHRQGDLFDFGWKYDSLLQWAEQSNLLVAELACEDKR